MASTTTTTTTQRTPWAWLIVLTLLAGVLRFSALDKPSVWGDEAATWRRISGSYQQMLDELRTAGFMPGHYLITWWIKDGFPYWGEFRPEVRQRAFTGGPGQRRSERNRPSGPRNEFVPTHRLIPGGLEPTPFLLRFVPALCGTLMVPAMYLLASHLVRRRTALLVALYTCLSAYMLGYSRDAKMYMQFWFCATLHVGCLLWWLDAYRNHDVVRPATKQAELGEGVAGVLPGDHVGHIARAFMPDANIDAAAADEEVSRGPSRLATLIRWACWLASGLAMISFSAVGLGIVGIEAIILLATIPLRLRHLRPYVEAVTWPGRAAFAAARRRRAQAVAAQETVVASGAFPPPIPEGRTIVGYDASGRIRRSSLAPATFFSRLVVPPIIGFVLGAAAIVSTWSSYKAFTRFYEQVTDQASLVELDTSDAGISWVEPYNRPRTASSHFLYNATAYLMSWEWPKAGAEGDLEPRAFHALSTAATVLLIAIAAGLVPWRQLIDRVTGAPPRERGPMPLTSAFVLGMWVIVPAYAFYVASGAWTWDGKRTEAETPSVAIARAFYPTAANEDAKPLIGALTRDRIPKEPQTRSFWPFVIQQPPQRDWNELLSVHNVDWRKPRPWAVAAVVVALVGVALSRRLTPQMVAGGVLVVVALWGLLYAVYVLVPMQERSVWMPRYAGFIWPAFAIVVCVLIQRLPLLPIRWAVVALLLGANVTNWVMRCRMGEPPTAVIAQDFVATKATPTARTFATIISKQFGGPGTGSVNSSPNAYYITLGLRKTVTPNEVYGLMGRDYTFQRLGTVDASVGLLNQIRRDRAADAFYLWHERVVGGLEGETDAKLRATLGAEWQRAEPPQQWTIYDHWTWRRLYVLERHYWKRDPKMPITPATRRAAGVVPVPLPRPAATRAVTRPVTTSSTVPARAAATAATSRPVTAPTTAPASTRAVAIGAAVPPAPATVVVATSRAMTVPHTPAATSRVTGEPATTRTSGD